MPVRLDDAQWARILALSGSAAPTSAVARLPKSNEVVFLLALEGDAPNPKWSWAERLLDTIVQTVQPAPALTHVELCIPPHDRDDEMHFATYLGKTANWGSGFGSSREFYLEENGRSWRAIPILATGAASRMRAECAKHVGTSYGSGSRLFNYPFAIPPLRSLAWTLRDEIGADAHCATLAARCIKRALPEVFLPEVSGWYGPSTLFLELSRRARMVSYRDRLASMETLKALPETEEATCVCAVCVCVRVCVCVCVCVV